MAAKCVYGDRQIRPRAPAAGSAAAADVVWFGPSTRCHLHSCSDTLETGTAHNARHQRDLDSQCLFASGPKGRRSLIVKSGDFPVEFDEGGGLKNRCRVGEKKLDHASPDFTYT